MNFKLFFLAFITWLIITVCILIMQATASTNYLNKEEVLVEHEVHLDGYTEAFFNTQIHFCGADGPDTATFPDMGFCRDGKIIVLFKDKDSKKYRERELEQKFYWKEDTGLQCDFAYVGDRCDVVEIKKRGK